LTEAAWRKLADNQQRCLLFYPAEGRLSPSARRYIELGEQAGVATAYKCSVRTPWWRVPLVQRPDLLFAYMNHDRPRFVRNSAGVHILNSLYGIRLKSTRRVLGQDLLPIASLNSVTLLAAEVLGRSYGGGLLKHEPTEVASLPAPSEQAMMAVGARLKLLASQIAAQLRSKDSGQAVDIVDKVVLVDHLGFDYGQIKSLRAARDFLMSRRTQRNKGKNGKN